MCLDMRFAGSLLLLVCDQIPPLMGDPVLMYIPLADIASPTPFDPKRRSHLSHNPSPNSCFEDWGSLKLALTVP